MKVERLHTVTSSTEARAKAEVWSVYLQLQCTFARRFGFWPTTYFGRERAVGRCGGTFVFSLRAERWHQPWPCREMRDPETGETITVNGIPIQFAVPWKNRGASL
jgi:hypothetical protein